jgi:MerR family redox-sensitive transcriptional activator SoxR
MPRRGERISIGELARRTGLASSALRYYERIGLLSAAGRTGGRRQYGTGSVERVASIQLFQDAGFTLGEIRLLLATRGRRSRSWVGLVEGKLRELDTLIARAEHARTLVQHALACPHRNLFTCANFRAALQARRGSPGHRPVLGQVGAAGDSST